MYYLVISLTIVLIILFLHSYVYIKLQFLVDENGFHTTLTVYLLMKRLKIRRQIGPGGIRKPGRDKGNDDPVKKHGLSEILDEYTHVRDFYNSAENTIKYLMKKMNIEEIRIVATIGTNNACLTAISVGLACAVAGMLISVISSTINVCRKNISIIPDFSGNRFNLNLYCIFRTKIAYIIIAGLKYLSYLLMRKVKKVSQNNKKCK